LPMAEALVRLYSLALRLYPARVRGEYEDEMQAVFRLKAAEAAKQSVGALFTFAYREARDLPQAILSAHADTGRGRMQHLFPSTSDQSPWTSALLSLLPFIIAGPVRLALSYQPGWIPEERPLPILYFLLVSTLVVAGGLVLGAAKKFPRWAYPYPIVLAFSVYTLGRYAAYLMQVDVLTNSFLLYLAGILIVLWLPGLRAFYRQMPKDWTLLTYGLFGLVLYLLSTVDFDEFPRLNLLVLLPSVLGLSAAVAHLRIRSAVVRVAVLLAGTYAGLFFSLLPIFQGMITIWIGIVIGSFMLLAYGIILTAILLAPMLVKGAVITWREYQASR